MKGLERVDNMGVKRIGIDIDGTITTMDIMIDIFNRETGKVLSKDDITEYNIGLCYGLSEEESGLIWKEFTKELVTRSIPIWNIYDFMDRWKKYGVTGSKENEIIIVTARPEKYEELTLGWLNNNKIDFDEAHFGYDRKIDAVRELGLDVFVDDKVDNIRDIDGDSSLECVGYIADQPYNRCYQTENRVYNESVIGDVL